MSSFTDEITSLGMKPGSRVIGIDEVVADFEQSEIFGVPEGEQLIRLVRIRTGDGVPIGIQRTHLVANLVPGLATMVSENFSLYGVLLEHFGVRPTEAVETYSVGLLERRDADLLDAKQGVPVFLIGRVTRAGNEVFEHTSSVMLGDKYRIRLGLRN